MSHYTDEPRFTIEQIDLLQRLRRSGMTKRDIIHALETLDRLDQEHVEKFGKRHGYGNSHASCNSSSTTSSSFVTAATQTPYSGASPSPSNSYDTSPPPCSTHLNGRESLNNEKLPVVNGRLSPSRFNSNVNQRTCSYHAMEEEMDLDEKVEELMRRDSTLIKEEIKSFLSNRMISQTIVGQVTGMSRSFISQWLLQQGLDMSEPKKRTLYKWYLLEKTSPGATLNMRPASSTTEDLEWKQSAPANVTTPGNFRLRRGSRFTWRKECLTVMESYFNENQYPDEAKREEISNACNAVIQKPGRKLTDSERVTALKVYNWFANRRKEIKRRANIEAAILETHGIDVQSPGGHSNSDDIDGSDFMEQDENTSHSDPQQDPISLAVEMAAVNHSILALARQGGGEIKREVVEDD
ncbi:homeobox-containing protein 1a isoform X1 [Leucoraja erinacea]|uniref:homeobox-containing protein 1a isoform X1 n=1 Tax=Leucoraja erinaceus TaxID=7782 RepID=UPI00245773D9|nr:homeobox-containing protein 1a isoform X1 [Leucoraja erinacea]